MRMANPQKCTSTRYARKVARATDELRRNTTAETNKQKNRGSGGGRRFRKCLAEPASSVRRGPSEESVKHETPFTSRTRFGRCATSNQNWSRVLSNSSSESSCRIHTFKPACRPRCKNAFKGKACTTLLRASLHFSMCLLVPLYSIFL